MYNYRAFDLAIASELPFRELLPNETACQSATQIKITFNAVSPSGLLDPPTLKTEFYQATSTAFWLYIPKVARFLIANGEQIYIDPMPESDDDSIRLFVLGSCMGALLMQRQLLLLHGNAINIGGHCVSFIGNSGAGKSTLSAAFFKRGYSILADDICAINNFGDVLPSFPQIKLWQDAAKKLIVNTQSLQRIRPNIDKFAVPLKLQFHNKATPLKIVYLLEIHHEKEINMTTIEGIEKCYALRHHVYRKQYLSNRDHEYLCFKQCMMLASKIELIRIMRPANEFNLDALIDKIKIDLMQREIIKDTLTQ